MGEDQATGGRFPWKTVDRVRAEHGRLLALEAERSGRDTVFVGQARAFVEGLAECGALFDDPAERKAIQGYLDYWVSELASKGAADEHSALAPDEIRDFDVEVLRQLQDAAANPFSDLVRDLGALNDEERESAEGALKVLEQRGRSADLRFEGGLLREIANQAVGDPEGTRLAEFCLWHLFEDRETRIGNKIYRPFRSEKKDKRVDFFSCRQYLERKAQALYDALPEASRKDLLDALVDIAKSSSERLPVTVTHGGDFPFYAHKLPNLVEFLRQSKLAWEGVNGEWHLVHPALGERWARLRDEINRRQWEAETAERTRAKAESERRRRWALVGTAVSAVAFSLVSLYFAVTYLEHRAMASLTEADSSLDGSQRVAAAIRGLEASRYARGVDTSYAWQVANDAINSVVRDEVQSNKLALSPAPVVPTTRCEPRLTPCTVLAVSGDGKHLAVMSVPKRSTGASERKEMAVKIRVFGIEPHYSLDVPEMFVHRYQSEQLQGKLEDLFQKLSPDELIEKDNGKGQQREAKVVQLRTDCEAFELRFSMDNKVVSLECPYESTAESGEPKARLQWIPLAIQTAEAKSTKSGAPTDETLEPVKTLRLVADLVERTPSKPISSSGPCPAPRPRGINSVFLLSNGKAWVTAGDDGYVQVWHAQDGSKGGIESRTPCVTTEFRADFVRVIASGRPAAIDVREDEPGEATLYAILALDPKNPTPVIRLYRQTKAIPGHASLFMEHYPPQGTGTPVAVDFTASGTCLRVQSNITKTSDARGRLEYFLVFDRDHLIAVASALRDDLKSSTSPLHADSHYQRAVNQTCKAKPN